MPGDLLLRGIQAVSNRLEMRRLGLSGARRVPTHMTVTERLRLYELASRCRDSARVLEIGSYLGASSCFLAAGLRKRGGHLYCVDTWHNETMSEGGRDTFADFRRNTAPFSEVITAVRKRSDELTAEDVAPPFDVIFVDGDHGEAAVSRDFLLVEAWLEDTGAAIFHDFLHFPAVAKIVGSGLATGQWVVEGLVDNMIWIRRAKSA